MSFPLMLISQHPGYEVPEMWIWMKNYPHLWNFTSGSAGLEAERRFIMSDNQSFLSHAGAIMINVWVLPEFLWELLGSMKYQGKHKLSRGGQGMWNASDRDPWLHPSLEQSLWHFLFSLVAKRSMDDPIWWIDFGYWYPLLTTPG